VIEMEFGTMLHDLKVEDEISGVAIRSRTAPMNNHFRNKRVGT
jgi:hypothetical protein